jgi:hypothetical protein
MKPPTAGLGHVYTATSMSCSLSAQHQLLSTEPRCLKVLIVGDEPFSLESTEWSLRHMNVYDIRITTVGTINAARLALRMEQFDVAIVDCIADGCVENENFVGEICCSCHATIRLSSEMEDNKSTHMLSSIVPVTLDRRSLSPLALQLAIEQALRGVQSEVAILRHHFGISGTRGSKRAARTLM